jgi:hypothetical protein
VADKTPVAGLPLHSDFAQRYAARRDPLGHAAATGAKLDHALDMQTQHWANLSAHLYGNRGEDE